MPSHERYQITVPDMTCVSCAETIKFALTEEFYEKLIEFNANPALSTITLTFSPPIDQYNLRTIIEEAGFSVEHIQPIEQQAPHHTSVPHTMTPHLIRALLAGLGGIALLAVSMLGVAIPLYGLITIATLSAPLVIFASSKIFYRAFKSLKYHHIFSMDVLFSLSIVVCFSVSVISIAFPALALGSYFSAALLIPAFRCLGIAIEKTTKQALMQEQHFVDRAPQMVTVLENGQEQQRHVSEVKVGDIIKITQGQMIPLDGLIIKGQADVMQKIWSGDQHPRRFNHHQPVFAGMEIESGELVIRVKHTQDQSLLARLDQKIIAAQNSKPNIEKFTDQIVHYFIPSVVIIALLSAALVSWFVSPVTAISTALCVLCVACPCVFGWLVPLTTQVARIKNAKAHAHVLKSDAMQSLTHLDTFIFDITGTLTQPTIVDVTATANISSEHLLKLAVALEKDCEHVIAKAIQEHGRHVAQGAELKGEQMQSANHLGRQGIIGGAELCIGPQRLMRQRSINLEPYQETLDHLHQQGKTALFVVQNQQVIGYLTCEQSLKSEAKWMLNALKTQGIEDIKISTGSDRCTAQHIANELSIPLKNVLSEQTPEQKLRLVRLCQLGIPLAESDRTCEQQVLLSHIEKLDNTKHPTVEQLATLQNVLQRHRRHHVGYAGDGGNDILAMNGADVSFVMSSGDVNCRQNADIMLLGNSLQSLVDCLNISQQYLRNIKLNLVITIVFNSVMIAIAAGALIPAGIVLSPGIAAAFMIVQASIVLASISIFKQQSITTPDDKSGNIAVVKRPFFKTVTNKDKGLDGETTASLIEQGCN